METVIQWIDFVKEIVFKSIFIQSETVNSAEKKLTDAVNANVQM